MLIKSDNDISKQQPKSTQKIDNSAFKYPPLLSVTEGTTVLESHIQSFFEGAKSMALNTSIGIDSVQTTVAHLRSINKKHDVLYLVGSHQSASNIEKRFHDIELDNETFKEKQNKSTIYHMQGKTKQDKNNAPLCKRQDMIHQYAKANVIIPSAECLKSNCDYTKSCTYAKQFKDAEKTTIHLMTHVEITNEASAWFKGSIDTGHDSKSPDFTSTGWKPRHIVIDGNFLTNPTKHKETLASTRFTSLRAIINDVLNDTSLHNAIKAHKDLIISDHQNMRKEDKSRSITFLTTEQYIQEKKQVNADRVSNPQSTIMETIFNYISNDFDESKLGNLRFSKTLMALVQSTLVQIAERYKGIPILILNTSSNEPAIKSIVDDIDFHSVQVKDDDAINIYQLDSCNWTQDKLKDPTHFKYLIQDLKSRMIGYKSVGLVTYQHLNGGDNFYLTLARELGITIYGYFGNLDGLTEFDDTDLILVIGRYQVPQLTTEDFHSDIHGAQDKDKFKQDRIYRPVIMKTGETSKIRSYDYIDPDVQQTNQFLSRSETIKALGLGRVSGQPKDIVLYSNENLGGDVEITGFFRYEKRVCTNAIKELMVKGFCQDTPKELMNLGLKKAYANKKDTRFYNECIATGRIKKMVFKVTDKHSNTRPHTYYVSDLLKLETYFNEQRAVIKSISPLS